jgi:hypothetical protein
MKFTTYAFISILLLLTGCNPNNPQPNPNTTSVNSNWKFKFTINGTTYKAEGNNTNDYSGGDNFCYASGTNGIKEIYMRISSLNSTSYISGGFGAAIISLDNPVLGTNPLTSCALISIPWYNNNLPITSPNYDGYSLTLNGPMLPNSNVTSLGIRLPINITDLGTPGNNDEITFGNPIKGNYSGTIYVKSGGTDYDTPVNIDIDFVALRL